MPMDVWTEPCPMDNDLPPTGSLGLFFFFVSRPPFLPDTFRHEIISRLPDPTQPSWSSYLKSILKIIGDTKLFGK